MNRRFLFPTGWLLPALALLAAGCVERHYVIEVPNAPGAIVVENNRYAFTAPVVRSFRYYGKYRFTVKANGFEDKEIIECIRAPWYEYFPLDFITENLLPFYIRDHRTFTYTLEHLKSVPPEIVKARAEALRVDGRALGEPLPAAVLVPPPGAVVSPPAVAPPGEVAPVPRVLPPNGAPVPQPVPVPPAPRAQPTPAWTPSGR